MVQDHRPPRRLHAIPPVLCLILASCKGGVENGRSRAEAGSRPSVGAMTECLPLPHEVASDADVTIGDTNPDSAQYAFSGVTSVATTANGMELVLDAPERRVRIFDQAGRFVRDIGREGRGPGEFIDPVGMGVLGDSLVVLFDRQLERVTVFHLGGSLVFTKRVGVGLMVQGLVLRIAALDLQTLVFETFRGYRQPARIGVDGTGALLRVHVDITQLDSLVTFEGRDAIPLHTEAQPYPLVLQAPFSRAPHWALGPSVLAFGRSDEPWIRIMSLDGQVLDSVELSDFPDQVTSVDIAEYKASQRALVDDRTAAPLRRAVENALSSLAYPSTWPWFRSVLFDRCGSLWVERVRPREPTRVWDVFDSRLRYLGEVRTPSGLTVHVVDSTGLWGTRTDSLGAVQVQRYRFVR